MIFSLDVRRARKGDCLLLHFGSKAQPGLVLIEETRRGDARGFFAETWKESDFRAAGIPGPFVQDNHARSARGVLRGLHYQLPPRPQGKLIRIVRGEVFDVGVDLRKGSPTYGRWAGVRLSGDDGRMLWVPPGFAHGYVVMSETCDFTCGDTRWPGTWMRMPPFR